jgi:hypothetical protein
MSQASTVRAYTDGVSAHRNGAPRMGHRQGPSSRTSVLPSDSISQSGGPAAPRHSASEVQLLAGGLIYSDIPQQGIHQRDPQVGITRQKILNISNFVRFGWDNLTIVARAQVNVIPHSSVPLAPRVTVPPIPNKLPLDSFNGMSLELQEAAVIEDILYVFMVWTAMYVLTVRDLKANISVITTRMIIQAKQIVLPGQSLKLQPVSIQVCEI